MTSIENKISAALASNNQKLIHCIQVKLKGGIGKSDAYAAFSDLSFSIFKKETKKKSTPWILFSSISIDDKSVTLKFQKKSFIIYPTDVKNFVSCVFDVIQRILLPSELLSFSFDDFHSFVAYPNPRSVISRIRQKAAEKKFDLDSSMYSSIMNAFTTSRNEIDMSKFKSSLTPFIVDALPLAYEIKMAKIRATSDGIDPYEVMMKVMNEKNRLRLIEIEGTAKNSFDAFMTTLCVVKPNKLFTLSFDSSEFGQKHLEAIENYVVNEKKIKALEFHNAISPTISNYFNDSFFSNMQLTCLNLDNTQSGIDTQRLFSRLKDIVVLSLANCKLDISTILPQMNVLTKLRVVNLSGNKCTEASKLLANPLPPSIISIYANKVKWERGCLVAFMNYRVMKLSISYADTTADDWNRLFESLAQSTNNTLAALIWDGNKVHNHWFKYLRNQACLDYLSVNDCFTKNHPELLAFLADYLQSSTLPLNTLAIRGTDINNLGNNISQVIEAVQKSPRLQNIDIYGQKGGDHSLISLLKVLPKLRIVSCDGMGPLSSSVQLLTLLDNANKLGIAFSYPSEDIDSLVSSGSLTKEQAIQIFEKCGRQPKMVKTQPANSLYLPPRSHFDDGYQVYKFIPNDQFPRFLKKKELAFYTSAPPMTKIAPIIVKSNGEKEIASPKVINIQKQQQQQQQQLHKQKVGSSSPPSSPKSPRNNKAVKTIIAPKFVFEEEPITIELSFQEESTITQEQEIKKPPKSRMEKKNAYKSPLHQQNSSDFPYSDYNRSPSISPESSPKQLQRPPVSRKRSASTSRTTSATKTKDPPKEIITKRKIVRKISPDVDENDVMPIIRPTRGGSKTKTTVRKRSPRAVSKQRQTNRRHHDDDDDHFAEEKEDEVKISSRKRSPKRTHLVASKKAQENDLPSPKIPTILFSSSSSDEEIRPIRKASPAMNESKAVKRRESPVKRTVHRKSAAIGSTRNMPQKQIVNDNSDDSEENEPVNQPQPRRRNSVNQMKPIRRASTSNKIKKFDNENDKKTTQRSPSPPIQRTRTTRKKAPIVDDDSDEIENEIPLQKHTIRKRSANNANSDAPPQTRGKVSRSNSLKRRQ